MAVAFDAATDFTGGTGEISGTHTPAGTPRGAVVGVVVNGTTSDEVTGVTYGGTAMTEVTGSPHTNAASPGCSVHIFFLGASVPTGAQTVTISVGGSSVKDAWVYTVTADDDTSVVDTTAVDGAGTGNHTGTLSLGAVACHCAEFIWSNGNSTLRISPLTGWSAPLNETDFGSEVAGFYTYDTVDTADVTMGWSHDQADSGAALGIAIREGAAGGGAATVVVPNANTITLQGQVPSVAAATGATISAPVVAMSFGAQTPRAKGGASVSPSPAILSILPQSDAVIAGDTVVPATQSTITLEMQQVFIDASQASKAAGVSIWEGVSFPEGVTDIRTTVGRGGTNDDSE